MRKSKEVREHQKDAFEKWLTYWKTTCDWPASPEAWEAWNGAIDLICKYFKNGFCEEDFYESIPRMDEVIDKLQRFKVKL